MGTQDFGILISAPGTDALTGAANKITMNTSHPFIKIDTQNKVGFQTITMLITTDPPEPSGTGTAYTTIYHFAHGYKYIPSIESLVYVSSPPPGASFTQTYFQDSGIIGAHTVNDQAVFYIVPDATNVYFIIAKTNFGGGSANLLTGTNLQITPHVFVEDIGV